MKTITVETQDASVPFHFPDEPGLEHHVQAILNGSEYPLADAPGYAPRVIVDVGANIGAFAVLQALNYPEAIIHCFEPNPRAVRFLEMNVSMFENVHVHAWGLADADGQAKLFEGAQNLMQNSMFRSVETVALSSEIQIRHAGKEFARLGLSHISVLKVDTEGVELPILTSCEAVLGTTDQLYVEYHSETDRRRISNLLEKRFVLGRSRADVAHRGTCLYISTQMIQRCPSLGHFEVATRTP